LSEAKFCFLIQQQLLQLHNVQVSEEHASHSASQKEARQRLQVPLPDSSPNSTFALMIMLQSLLQEVSMLKEENVSMSKQVSSLWWWL
jgi:hypothetical protein